MPANQTVDLESEAKSKNMVYFIKRLVYWFIGLAVLFGIASYLVLTVPSETEILVVLWLGIFAGFVFVGVVVSGIVSYTQYIVRHGLIVENTPEIQQVLREEDEMHETIKPKAGARCDKCGSDKVYVEENSGVCAKCGVGIHTI